MHIIQFIYKIVNIPAPCYHELMNRFADVVKSLAAWLLDLLTLSAPPSPGAARQAPLWAALLLLLACLAVLAVLMMLAFAWLTS